FPAMRKKGVLTILVCFLCLVSLAQAGIDLSETQIDFNGLLIGSEGQKTLVITSDSVVPIKIKAELSDDLQGIVSIGPKHNLFVQKNVPLELKLTAQSADVNGKLYLFFEKIEQGAITSFGNNLVTLGVSVSQTEQEKKQLVLSSVTLPEIEEGGSPILSLKINNNGNAVEELVIFASVEQVEHNFSLIVPAFYQGTENIILPFILDKGEYPLRLIFSSDSFNAEKELPVVVLSAGTLTKKVDLPAVFSEVVDGKVYVTTVLNNQLSPVQVKLRQQIYDQENLLQEIESEQFLFAGENRIETEFELNGSGQYLVKTTAYYGNTYTDTYENKFEMTEAGAEIPLSASLWVTIFSLLVIFLVIMGKKKWK
ncbi:MAG: hypothetical protein ABIA37_02665, partial [Candidatus Woesearchaeota archaeon]